MKSPSAEACYRGGVTTRDRVALAFEERTGRNYYASISKGRPRLPRFHAKGEVGRPAAVAVGTRQGKGVLFEVTLQKETAQGPVVIGRPTRPEPA
jgi:hypothetical protein